MYKVGSSREHTPCKLHSAATSLHVSKSCLRQRGAHRWRCSTNLDRLAPRRGAYNTACPTQDYTHKDCCCYRLRHCAIVIVIVGSGSLVVAIAVRFAVQQVHGSPDVSLYGYGTADSFWTAAVTRVAGLPHTYSHHIVHRNKGTVGCLSTHQKLCHLGNKEH